MWASGDHRCSLRVLSRYSREWEQHLHSSAWGPTYRPPMHLSPTASATHGTMILHYDLVMHVACGRRGVLSRVGFSRRVPRVLAFSFSCARRRSVFGAHSGEEPRSSDLAGHNSSHISFTRRRVELSGSPPVAGGQCRPPLLSPRARVSECLARVRGAACARVGRRVAREPACRARREW